MSATTERDLAQQAPPEARPGVSIRLPGLSWETAAYLALAAVALAMRLWDLGSRAYHHDESLHAYYSWNLFTGRGFSHDPLLHGPFQFHVTALGLFLFGDNLVAPRVFPALFGTALVAMPLLLRDYLGKWGALATAALLAFSPSILYFSRFIREDIFAIVWDLGLVVAVWRYLESRKNRWLYAAAAFLVLTFSTKESAFITAAVVGSFLLAWWLARLAGPAAETPSPSRDGGGPATPAATPAAADDGEPGGPYPPAPSPSGDGEGVREPRARPPLRRVRERVLAVGVPPDAGLFLLLATLTLPLFSAGVGYVVERVAQSQFTLVAPATCQFPCRVGAPESSTIAYAAAGMIAGLLFLIAVGVGLAWKGRTWLVAFGVFWGVFFLLHTTFLTNMVGLGSGVWQALGYWIGQQSVERGNQPWYYYFVLLPLYETIAFAFGVVAIVAAVRRLGLWFWGWGATVAAIGALLAASLFLLTESKALYVPLAIGVAFVTYLALQRGARPFDWFLVHWAALSLLLYILAGEKMPWLLTHLAVPFAFLAGRFIGQMAEEIPWRSVARAGGVALLVSVPVLMLAIRALVLSADADRSPIKGWAFIGALFFTAVMIGIGVYLWSRVGTRRALQMVAFSAIAFLAFFTVRSGIQAAYANADVPRDMLIYTQTSPEVAALAARIDGLAAETGKGKKLSILIDTEDGFGWPWFWYLRSYENVRYQDMTTWQGEIREDVVVLNAGNRGKMLASAERYTPGETIPFRQWFPEEEYRGYTAGKFYDDFFSRDAWSRLLNFYTYRTLNQPLGHIDSVVFYARGLPGV